MLFFLGEGAALGVDFPLLWGVLTFFLSFIPYIGRFSRASVPRVLLAFAEFDLFRALIVIVGTDRGECDGRKHPAAHAHESRAAPVTHRSFLWCLWTFLLGGRRAFLAVPLLSERWLPPATFDTTRWFAASGSLKIALGVAFDSALLSRTVEQTPGIVSDGHYLQSVHGRAAGDRADSDPEPPLARFSFADTRLAWFWLIVRVYCGWQWLEAGSEKVTNPAWFGPNAGSSLTGFVNGALQKATGTHPDVMDWYANFLQALVLPNAACSRTLCRLASCSSAWA